MSFRLQFRRYILFHSVPEGWTAMLHSSFGTDYELLNAKYSRDQVGKTSCSQTRTHSHYHLPELITRRVSMLFSSFYLSRSHSCRLLMRDPLQPPVELRYRRTATQVAPAPLTGRYRRPTVTGSTVDRTALPRVLPPACGGGHVTDLARLRA
mgnify:CR=1 FL=1